MQVGNVHVLSALHVAVSAAEYPTTHFTAILVPVFDLGADGVVPPAASVAGQGSSLQVGNSHVSSALQVALAEVEYPTAQVTSIPVPVLDAAADGVVPSSAGVAGQGWSLQFGNTHVSSTLQVAVSEVEYPVAQVTAIPTPVGDTAADGVMPSAASVAGQGSSVQVGNVHVSSSLQVAVLVVEYPVAHVTV
jgi:hypothetical protein